MIERARVAVVVPAHNEERWIAETVRRMPAFVDHVIVVDDASRDGTSREAIRPADPRVEVIRHADNRGVGAAIVRGYRRARAMGAGVAAVMAGDGQMHPDDLAAVASPIARGAHLRELADLIAVHRDELADTLVSEVGKPTAQALGEVDFAGDLLRYSAEWDRRLEGEILPGEMAGPSAPVISLPRES